LPAAVIEHVVPTFGMQTRSDTVFGVRTEALENTYLLEGVGSSEAP
jgi:hypothetical protein